MVCEEVALQFGEANKPPLRELVAGSLVNKATKRGELDRADEALATYEEVVDRFDAGKERFYRRESTRTKPVRFRNTLNFARWCNPWGHNPLGVRLFALRRTLVSHRQVGLRLLKYKG